MPTAIPAAFTESVNAPASVPASGLTLSHGWLLAAVHETLPPPTLLTPTVCAAGLLPAAALKATLLLERLSTGRALSTGLSAGPTPAGVKVDVLVSKILSKEKPSSRIHTLIT